MGGGGGRRGGNLQLSRMNNKTYSCIILHVREAGQCVAPVKFHLACILSLYYDVHVMTATQCMCCNMQSSRVEMTFYHERLKKVFIT